MYIARYAPAPELAPYIYEYVIVSVPLGMPLEKCIPDGFVKLFIYTGINKPQYRDEAGNIKDWGDGFSGHPVDDVFYVHADKPIDVVVCSFRPQGIYHLYRTPIHQFNNNLLPADAVMGMDVALLKEQLQEAGSDLQKIAIINRYYKHKVRSMDISYSSPISYVQDVMLACNGKVNIEELAINTNITRRSLERNFMTQVGMTPKYFTRVLRFNYAIGQRQVDPNCNWQDIIYNCGYFDQSHFIKEFKHFTGATPELFYQQDHSFKEICTGRNWQDDNG